MDIRDLHLSHADLRRLNGGQVVSVSSLDIHPPREAIGDDDGKPW